MHYGIPRKGDIVRFWQRDHHGNRSQITMTVLRREGGRVYFEMADEKLGFTKTREMEIIGHE